MKLQVFSQGEFHSNCSVISQNNRCLIVDIPYNSFDLIEYVKTNNFRVDAIVLTHGHFDHCGGVAQFERFVGCENVPIICSPKDFDLCRHAANNPWSVPCENCYPTTAAKEGYASWGGIDVQIIETPGHTMGSVVFLCEQYMFSGDTLFCDSIGRVDFAESSPSMMKSSLQKIKKLTIDYKVIPGHGEITSLLKEKNTNGFLR